METLNMMSAIPFSILALTGLIQTARADDVAAPRPHVVNYQTVSSGPNETLLHSGFWILGLSYVPAVIVTADSSRVGRDTRTVTIRSSEREETRVSSLSLRVVPAQVGGHAYDHAAVGTF